MVARDMADINEMMDKLCARNMDFEEEEDVAGFLGVHIERTPEYVKLTQKGLTKRIIEALQIEDLPAVATPATGVLGKDPDGDPPNCTFNYASVIGMLWYLGGMFGPPGYIWNPNPVHIVACSVDVRETH